LRNQPQTAASQANCDELPDLVSSQETDVNGLNITASISRPKEEKTWSLVSIPAPC